MRGESSYPNGSARGGGAISFPAINEVAVIDTVAAANEVCTTSANIGFSDPLIIQTAGWGDIAALASGEARAVDDVVGVEEFVFIIEKFGGLGGAAGSGGLPIKARTDMLGVFAAPAPVLDGVISVGEIASIVDAFGGDGYPFVPSASVVCP